MAQGGTSLWVQGSGLKGDLQYLEQELETGDALERQNQEGLEGKALADGALSSFSRTSRKLLLLFLQGREPRVRRGTGHMRDTVKARGVGAQWNVCR